MPTHQRSPPTDHQILRERSVRAVGARAWCGVGLFQVWNGSVVPTHQEQRIWAERSMPNEGMGWFQNNQLTNCNAHNVGGTQVGSVCNGNARQNGSPGN